MTSWRKERWTSLAVPCIVILEVSETILESQFWTFIMVMVNHGHGQSWSWLLPWLFYCHGRILLYCPGLGIEVSRIVFFIHVKEMAQWLIVNHCQGPKINFCLPFTHWQFCTFVMEARLYLILISATSSTSHFFKKRFQFKSSILYLCPFPLFLC